MRADSSARKKGVPAESGLPVRHGSILPCLLFRPPRFGFPDAGGRLVFDPLQAVREVVSRCQWEGIICPGSIYLLPVSLKWCGL